MPATFWMPKYGDLMCWSRMALSGRLVLMLARLVGTPSCEAAENRS